MDRKPEWLKKRLRIDNANIQTVLRLIKESKLHTVCQSAECPNIFECFSKGTATFMLMGDRCTRNCSFCAVAKGRPYALDKREPINVAEAVKEMGLKYAVLTSVTRDDLDDFGSEHFALTVREIKKLNPDCSIECLIPDFKGSIRDLKTVADAPVEVLNHNLETVRSKYSEIRPGADYDTSLGILHTAKKIRNDIYTKSGFMVGLGERPEEIESLLKDLKDAGCDMVTIGQYLRPGEEQAEVKRYYTFEEFEHLSRLAEKIGIKAVASGAFVRSSYKASDLLNQLKRGPGYGNV